MTRLGLQARAYGADACLLIASVLPNKDLELLIKVANKLGLHQLIEVHVNTCRSLQSCSVPSSTVPPACVAPPGKKGNEKPPSYLIEKK